ncbi:MAG: hypothetical protein J1F33_07545, partial [Clostridiales bacterium]|nr:hypothetical protein [Clostridiales bacterium]
MLKSKNVIKYLLTLLTCAVVIIACAFAVWGFTPLRDKPTSGGDGSSVLARFTYGNTYTIDGVEYTLGEGEDECIDYYVGLGLDPEEYNVELKKFTYVNGSDGTAETTDLRNAGTYEFEVTPLEEGAETYSDVMVIAQSAIHFDVNKLGFFGNASGVNNATGHIWQAHGEITTIFLLDDGWYNAEFEDKLTVESRVITNSSYTYDSKDENGDGVVTGTEIKWKTIMIDGEYGFPSGDNNYTTTVGGTEVKCVTPKEATDKTSKYDYDGVQLSITNRQGVKYWNMGVYSAKFTFNVPDQNNYMFDYSDESKLSHTYKGLSIPKTTRTDYSFTLNKTWYIINSGNKINWTGYGLGNEPYVPFSVKNGDETEVVDTVTYGQTNFSVNVPNDGTSTKNGNNTTYQDDNLYFSIDYKSTDGTIEKTIRPSGRLIYSLIWTNTGSSSWADPVPNTLTEDTYKNTLEYYINPSMPAGTYTLKITSSRLKVGGTYTLYVLPAELDPVLVEGVNTALQGPSGTNFYTIEDGKAPEEFHTDLTKPVDGRPGAQTALETWLNGNVKKYQYADSVERHTFWSNMKESDYTTWCEYYDTEVVLNYRRSTDGVNNYNDEETTRKNLTSRGEYIFHYSISAKNYATTGGSEDPNRENYSFTVRLFAAIAIYNDILAGSKNEGPYFADVKYTGSAVTPLVPGSSYYYIVTEGQPEYVNVGYGYVTLSVYATESGQSDLWGWGEVPDELKKEGNVIVTKSDDNMTITVRYNIVPADNAWTDPPSITSWLYQNFNSDVNVVKSTPKFKDIGSNGSDNTVIYYRVGVQDEIEDDDWVYDGTYSWIDVGGSLTVKGDEYDSTYFAVDGEGKIVETDDEVSSKLTVLHVGNYLLDSYISPILKPNGDAETDENKKYNVKAYHTAEQGSLSKISVLQGYNSWDVTPGMTGWMYKDFSDGSTPEGSSEPARDSNFLQGVPTFIPDDVKDKPVTYELHKNSTSGDLLLSFNLLTDPVPASLGTYGKVSEYLNDLDYGNYAILAKVKATDDYRELSTPITFSVSTATNTWVEGKSPSIEGWAYNLFTENKFNKGETVFGNGTAQYTIQYAYAESGVVSGRYYGDKEVLDYDELIAALKTLSATSEYGDSGVYNIHVVVPAATNHNYGSASPQDLRFRVSKADYAWKNNVKPTIAGWQYGQTPSTPDATGIAITYNVATEGGATEERTVESGWEISYEYYTVGYNNGVPYRDVKVDNLATATVGTYMMVVTLTYEKANYNPLIGEVVFNISATANAWKPNDAENKYTPEDRLEWIWGWPTVEADPQKPNLIGGDDVKKSGLINATAIDMVSGIVYTISKVDGTYTSKFTVTNAADRETLTNTLFGLGVGSYSLLLDVAATDNYGGLQANVFVEVFPADFTVTQDIACADGGWTWGDADRATKLTKPTVAANNVRDTVAYSYSIEVGGSSTSYGSFELLNDALSKNSVNTYTVVIIASCANYNPKEFRIEVTISPAQFANVTDPTVDDGGWKWGDADRTTKYHDASASTVAGMNDVASYSYRVTTEGSTASEEPGSLEALKTLIYGKPVGTYTVYVTISCGINYTAITREVTFKVLPAEFTGVSGPSGETSWEWDATETEIKNKVINVGYTAIPDTDSVHLNTTYEIITGQSTEKPADYDKLIEELMKKVVGTYTVRITVSCTNYEDLVRTINVTVNPAQFKNASGPSGETSWVWGETRTNIGTKVADAKFDPLPERNTPVKSYAIVTGPSTETSAKDYEDLLDKLAVLGVGTYTVKITVSCANYEGKDYSITITVKAATIEVTTSYNE